MKTTTTGQHWKRLVIQVGGERHELRVTSSAAPELISHLVRTGLERLDLGLSVAEETVEDGEDSK
jgi:predicted DNA-binding protein (UPF0278 family)